MTVRSMVSTSEELLKTNEIYRSMNHRSKEAEKMNKKKKSNHFIKTAKRLLKYITETYKLRLILVFVCIFLSAVASISVSLC